MACQSLTSPPRAAATARAYVSGRLRLTLTASQTFGSTYLFVRLLKNLSDSHGSFFVGSLLTAYK